MSLSKVSHRSRSKTPQGYRSKSSGSRKKVGFRKGGDIRSTSAGGARSYKGPKTHSTIIHKFLGEGKKNTQRVDGKSLRTLDERKVYEPSPDAISLSSSMVNMLQTYTFRLGGYTILTMVGGIINAFIAADPSAAGWAAPEWASLSSLFSEFRLRSLSVRVQRNFLTATPATGALAICSNLGTATNPGSYANAADNADVTWYSVLDASRDRDGKCGQVHTMHATDLNWSQVTTPTVEPYAGAPGSIQFYSDNGTAVGAATALFQVLIAGVYEFRIRV